MVGKGCSGCGGCGGCGGHRGCRLEVAVGDVVALGSHGGPRGLYWDHRYWMGISDAAVGFIEEERCGQYQLAINESCGYRAGCEQRKGYVYVRSPQR